MNAVNRLLDNYKTTKDDSALSLTVTTDGSVAGLARLLIQLEQAEIGVIEFAQRAPSLDDVFLKIISTSKEKNNE